MLRPAQQTLRPGDQHHRHDQELGHQGQLGKIHGKAGETDKAEADAQRLHLSDEHGGNIRADDRAHAADDDHDEGVGDHRKIDAKIGRFAGDLQRAAQSGQQRAERENGGKQHRLVDAERAEHLAVLGRRAHQPAEPGARKHDVQNAQHDRRHHDEKDIVSRHVAVEDFDGAAETGSARAEQVLGSPQPERSVVDDQKDGEGRQQLEQLRRRINAAQQQKLDRRAQHRDTDCAQHNAAPKPERTAHRRHQRDGDVGPEHIERAVRDVDNARDAEDQRKPGGDEEQAGRRGKAVKGLERKAFPAHAETLAKVRESVTAFRRRSPSQSAEAGRNFFTSASDGSTLAPSTYLKSTMVPWPSLTASLPTKAPMVAWWSLAR